MSRSGGLPSGNGINDVGYDLIVLAGQSNMSGRGVAIDTIKYDVQDARIWQYPGSGADLGRIIQAYEPLQHADFAASTSTLGLGPGLPFARWYLSAVPENRRILLVPVSYGGTGFEGAESNGTWKVGAASLYEQAVAQTRAALAAAGPNSRVTAVLWLQGEKDGANGTAKATYQADFDALIDAFRSDLAISDLPFVLGEMTQETINSGSAYVNVDAVHIDTPRRKTRTAFAYNPGPGTLGYIDTTNGSLHFSAEGQRINGRNMFRAYLRSLANVTGTPPVAPTAPVLTQVGTSVSVVWTSPTGRVTDYIVETKIDTGAWTTISRPASNIDTRATITGLSGGQTVQVRVSSVNEQGTSAPSTVGTLTMATPPAQVTGLATGTPSGTAVPLTWSAAARADTYTVEYKVSTDSTWLTFGSVAATAATVSGLAQGTAYDFRVTGVNNLAGPGTPSTTVSATTTADASFTRDMFTGTGSLTSHVGEVGAAWTAHPNFAGTAGAVLTAAGRLRWSSSGAQAFYASGIPSTADYTVAADLFVASLLSGINKGIAGRVSTSASTLYALRYVVSSGQWQLIKNVAGTSTTLGTFNQALTVGQTYRMSLRMTGTTIVANIDGTDIITVTDAAVTAAGRAGIYGGGGLEADSTGIHIDNLQAS